jgi:hypothetical protein
MQNEYLTLSALCETLGVDPRTKYLENLPEPDAWLFTAGKRQPLYSLNTARELIEKKN